MDNKIFTLEKLSEILNIKYYGNPDLIISGISEIKNAKKNQLAFLFEKKYLKDIDKTNASCLLVNIDFEIDDKFSYLVSDKPKFIMTKILEIFNFKYNNFKGIHHLANISNNVLFGENVSVNSFVHIGQNVKIGKNVTIMSGSFIGDNSTIDDETLIYPNVTILANCIIGKKVIIHSGVVIGSDGYGFIQLDNNEHHKVPQIGNVIIEDNVEIGASVTIDRATIGSTIICEGTKIDNMVHIAHNVKIGKRSLIIAQTGIAGSTIIGDNVIIAGQSGVSGHLEIGNNSIILSRSGVTKNFPEKSKISGFPARNHLDELKNISMINKIPQLIKEIEELKEIIKSQNLKN
ncbi:MAG: UDP-3-O-(3-hydroxymyristoyl)glucosamine N-acyltransferase [Candidatus Sericytochromatia bacterium]|nr:UDP-3-O-(3-hydroxymyristoyl)glucosamine N-acyltransferase [Candidatus Sericytochromatia bacterium]